MARDWYVDGGLTVLIGQARKRYPGIVIGTIAGGGHVNTWPDTDHAPEPDGSVDAADFMIGPNFTEAECDEFIGLLVLNRDKRIAYIIWQGRIMSSRPIDGYAAWVWRPYRGKDRHTGHAHVSVNDKHENDNSPWNLGGKMWKYEIVTPSMGFPILNFGDDDANYDGYNAVVRMQALANVHGAGLKEDGNYGEMTRKALAVILKTDGRRVDMRGWTVLAGLTRVG